MKHCNVGPRVPLFRRFTDTNVQYTKKIQLTYEKLATKYPWICGYVFWVYSKWLTIGSIGHGQRTFRHVCTTVRRARATCVEDLVTFEHSVSDSEICSRTNRQTDCPILRTIPEGKVNSRRCITRNMWQSLAYSPLGPLANTYETHWSPQCLNSPTF